MKRLAIPLLLAVGLYAQGPQSFHGTSGGWGPFERNHPQHFLAGMACGWIPYLTAEKLGYKHPWLHSILWGVLAGFAKEFYDRKHGGRPEYGDVAYTGLGGAAVGFGIHFTRKHQHEFATAPKEIP